MNKETKLGDGVANEVKEEINRELSSTAKTLIRILFAYLNNKVQGIDIDDILGKLSKKDEDEIISLWSSQLVLDYQLHPNTSHIHPYMCG